MNRYKILGFFVINLITFHSHAGFLGKLLAGSSSSSSSSSQAAAQELFFKHERTVADRFSTNFIGDQPDAVKILLAFLRNPAPFKTAGLQIPSTILLHGDPGLGKTALARVVAGEAKIDLISLSPIDLSECYSGRKNAVQELFAYARNLKRPVTLLVDGIDALGISREQGGNQEDEKIVREFTNEMDDAKNENIFIIGTTHKPLLVNKAVRKKFRAIEQLSFPTEEQRRKIFELYLSQSRYPVDLSCPNCKEYDCFCVRQGSPFQRLLEIMKSGGSNGSYVSFSGDDIRRFVQLARTRAVVRNKEAITEADFYPQE